MASSFLRRLRILQMLKKKGDGYITAPQILKNLTHEGFDDVRSRTIERDLQDLSLEFPITCDTSTRPYQWWWHSDETIEIPVMGRNTALTFNLAEQHLEPLLPATSLKYLTPKFKQAKRVLQTKDKEKERKWIDKIRVVPHAVNLVPAKITDKVHQAVYDALFDEKMLSINYHPPSGKKSTRRIHPLALVYRGTTTELFAYEEEEQVQVKRFILNRIKKAELQIQSMKPLQDFNLDEFTNKEFAFPQTGEPIHFKAWISWDAKTKLIENPLSKNQTIEEAEDNAIIISATVIDSNELISWVLSLGARIKVLGPKSIKKKIKAISKSTSILYK